MVDWIQMLKNLSYSLLNVEIMTFYLFAFIGICLIISGIFGLVQFGNKMNEEPGKKKEAILKIVGGAMLFSLINSTIPALVSTFFGSVNIRDFYSLHFDMSADVYLAVKRVCQLAGVIWIGLGILTLIKEDEGQQSKSFKGVCYIVAGVMAMNYEYAAKVLSYLFSLLTQVFK